jgi:hypothetical protein
MLVKTFDGFAAEKKKNLLDQAASFLQQLDQENHVQTPTTV